MNDTSRRVRIAYAAAALAVLAGLALGITAHICWTKYIREARANDELRRCLGGHLHGVLPPGGPGFRVAYSRLPFYQYTDLYAPNVPLAFSGLFPVKQANKVQLRFIADGQVILSDGRRDVAAKNGVVEVDFPLRDKPELQTKTFSVSSGARKGTVRIDYWSPALYVRRGTKGSGVLLVSTDLPFRPRKRRLPEYILENRLQMRQFLGEEVVSAPASGRGEAVLDKLGHVIGKEPMDLSLPLTTHKRGQEILDSFLAKKTKIGCGAISYLARDYLLAADVPARAICLDAISRQTEEGIRVAFSEGHAINEMMVDGKWRWFDLSCYCFYARAGGNGPFLSIWDLLRALHVERKRDQVILGIYDPSRRQIAEVKVAESPTWATYLQKYFSGDKIVRYIELPD